MSEKKYIDRELLINEICKNRLMSKELVAQKILHIINEQPTADVEEVRHGKWIRHEKEGEIFANYECSVCSAYPTGGIISYYCPNCGAKMKK